MMRAMVLAAGLGTRLRPWTLNHPKALVPVAGIPMLEHILSKLENEGFDRIVVNIHHFGDQIINFLNHRKNKADICISDERNQLLDTGGGILKADIIQGCHEPLLIHNTDILSNAPLRELVDAHVNAKSDATLLTSSRNSTRKLIFNNNGELYGWMNYSNGDTRPSGICYNPGVMTQEAFSGIYILSSSAIQKMREWAVKASFPIMDFFLDNCREMHFRHFFLPSLRLLDIGKPDALSQADDFLHSIDHSR